MLDKRNREQKRREQAKAKAERRDQRTAERRAREPTAAGEDPDIAGIVPGPQPPRDE
jgi:hypothetical protein